MSYAENPRARFDYEILEKMTAGIVLAGHEVKAIKAGKCSIKGASRLPNSKTRATNREDYKSFYKQR